jgi:hypothetical protein
MYLVICGMCGKIRKDCKHFYVFLVCGSLLCVILFCLEIVKILTLTPVAEPSGRAV